MMKHGPADRYDDLSRYPFVFFRDMKLSWAWCLLQVWAFVVVPTLMPKFSLELSQVSV
jgi:hypothetical protein